MKEPTNNKIRELKELENNIRAIACRLQGLENGDLTPVYTKLLSSISDINEIRKASF